MIVPVAVHLALSAASLYSKLTSQILGLAFVAAVLLQNPFAQIHSDYVQILSFLTVDSFYGHFDASGQLYYFYLCKLCTWTKI